MLGDREDGYLERTLEVEIEPDGDRSIRSSVFSGLWLAVDALLEGKPKRPAAFAKRGRSHPTALDPLT
jgi:hypothetical protein